jgi:hypothetical protein
MFKVYETTSDTLDVPRNMPHMIWSIKCFCTSVLVQSVYHTVCGWGSDVKLICHKNEICKRLRIVKLICGRHGIRLHQHSPARRLLACVRGRERPQPQQRVGADVDERTYLRRTRSIPSRWLRGWLREGANASELGTFILQPVGHSVCVVVMERG